MNVRAFGAAALLACSTLPGSAFADKLCDVKLYVSGPLTLGSRITLSIGSEVASAKDAAVIVGLPESPVSALRLDHVHIEAAKGAVVKYAHMSTHDVTVRAAQGEPYAAGPDVVGLNPGEGR